MLDKTTEFRLPGLTAYQDFEIVRVIGNARIKLPGSTKQPGNPKVNILITGSALVHGVSQG
jgi:hypothetical protein